MFFDIERAIREMGDFRREFDNLFNRSGYFKGRSSFPFVNIYETNDDYKLVAELPGVVKEDVNITFTDNVLSISGKRPEKRYGEKYLTLRNECCNGDFEKSFRIPSQIQVNNIGANFTDGMLTVTLPKAEEAKPKKIEIQV